MNVARFFHGLFDLGKRYIVIFSLRDDFQNATHVVKRIVLYGFVGLIFLFIFVDERDRPTISAIGSETLAMETGVLKSPVSEIYRNRYGSPEKLQVLPLCFFPPGDRSDRNCQYVKRAEHVTRLTIEEVIDCREMRL